MSVPAAVGLILGILFFAPLLGVIFGAFSGWVISLFFNDTVHGVVSAIIPALRDFELYQIGMGLGFMGAFFRSSSMAKMKD